jgi:DNA invertase Pin-like site-specific DNA recombinase
MVKALIGYARCSTDKQDLAAQRAELIELGVDPKRIYTDHGLTGTNRLRPGLDQALAAVRGGDTLVVPKLDRLARSVPDARHIADALVARAKGKLRGKQPKLSEKQQRELRRMHSTGKYSISDLAELFSISRPTVYRTLARAAPGTK